MVKPVLLYGAGIWGTENRQVINTVQNKACRFFLGVQKTASNIATRGEMGWISIYTCQKLEVIRLWCRLCNLPATRLTKHVFQWSFDLAQNRMKKWDYFVLKMYRLNDPDFLNVIQPRFTPAIIQQSFSILKTAKNQQRENYLFNDRNLINCNKLRTYGCFTSRLITEDYVKLNIPRHDCRILSMLRCGTLPLHVENGRWCRPVKPLDQRICTYCNQNQMKMKYTF